jgi:hypothetical protein
MTAADARNQIQKIYKKHNPSKLEGLDNVMAKYAGKENQLLRAVKEKYGLELVVPWSYVLKNYSDDRFQDQRTEESLRPFQQILDGFASSIGGECTTVFTGKQPGAKRILVVRQLVGRDGHYDEGAQDWGRIEATVDEMRRVIHERYDHVRKGQSIASLHTDEHAKRKEEKRIEKLKQQKRDRGLARKRR